MHPGTALLDRVSHAAALSERGRVVLSGLSWTAVGQGVTVLVKLGSNLVLTRLLAPELFGLIGTALAVLAVLDLLSDMGLQPAVIRHADGESADVTSTAWWLGLARGGTLTAAACGLAIPAAAFYGEPPLAGLLIMMGLRPLLLALRSPAYPILRRQMNYRVLFVDEMAQMLLSTGTTLLLAVLTGSVWSIVAGVLTGALASVFVSWRAVPRCVTRPRRAVAADLLRFSGPVFLNTLVMAAWLKLDSVLGLKLIGPDAFGLYVVALGLAGAAEAMVVRVCDVYFSAMSRVPAEQRDRWHAAQVARVTPLAGPLAAFSVVVAPFAVDVMYDQRYRAVGGVLAILLARLSLRAFGQFRFQHLLAQGRVRVATLGYGLALGVQIMMLVPLTSRLGVAGLAWAALASTAVVTLTQELCELRRGTSTLTHLAWCGLWTAAGLALTIPAASA